MATDDEQTFLKQGSLSVTRERAKIDGESYRVAELRGASVEAVKPGIGPGVALAVVTAALGAVVFKVAQAGFFGAESDEKGFYSTGIILLLVGAVFLASALTTINTFRNREESYQVILHRRGAPDVTATELARRDDAEAIVAAVKEAVAAHAA